MYSVMNIQYSSVTAWTTGVSNPFAPQAFAPQRQFNQNYKTVCTKGSPKYFYGFHPTNYPYHFTVLNSKMTSIKIFTQVEPENLTQNIVIRLRALYAQLGA